MKLRVVFFFLRLTLTAVTTCIHFSPLYRLTATGESSDLAIKSLNELCCKKWKVQWKAERETLRLMCGSAGSEKNFLIHTCVSSKCTVPYEFTHYSRNLVFTVLLAAATSWVEDPEKVLQNGTIFHCRLHNNCKKRVPSIPPDMVMMHERQLTWDHGSLLL